MNGSASRIGARCRNHNDTGTPSPSAPLEKAKLIEKAFTPSGMSAKIRHTRTPGASGENGNMPREIVKLSNIAYFLKANGSEMTLTRVNDGWEMATVNAAVHAHRNGFAIPRFFPDLAAVERRYKSWSGIQQLVAAEESETEACLATCIECGCTDNRACWDEVGEQPCAWLVVDRADALGVCSACPDAVSRWEKGDRTIAVPAQAHPGCNH